MDELVEQPDIDFLIVADRAEAINGKLYLMGGAWDQLYVVDFDQPVQFSLAIGVIVPWASTNQEHPLRVAVENEDGTVIQPDMQIRVNMGRPPGARPGQPFRALIAVQGAWRLPGPGTYRIQATVDDARSRRTVFHAIAARPGTQP
jgi:hypothetical protein